MRQIAREESDAMHHETGVEVRHREEEEQPDRGDPSERREGAREREDARPDDVSQEEARRVHPRRRPLRHHTLDLPRLRVPLDLHR